MSNREKFEEWAGQTIGRIGRSTEPGYTHQYEDSHTQMAWVAWDAALATANERIRELEAFQLACVKQLYEMLGVDGSDGEYRFKWAALELRSKLDQLAAEREVSDKLVAELQSAIQTLEDINDLPSMRACMEQTLSEVAAIRAKQGGEG